MGAGDGRGPLTGPGLIPTRVNIGHTAGGGAWHPGRAEYCHRCHPEPNPRGHVVPASRRGDYVAPRMFTTLTTREALTALADAGPYTAPTGPPLADTPRGTRVLFQVGARTWHAGVVETVTLGAGAPRVAYVHPRDLARARAEKHPVEPKRARPRQMWALPTGQE